MPFELFLALRYLRVRRGRWATAQVTALAAATGIACGVAALIVALALANGFRDELRDKILRGTAHLTLLPPDDQPPAAPEALLAQLRNVEGVVAASATTYTGALLSGPDAAAYAILRGVDVHSERAVAELRRVLVDGTLEPLLRGGAPPRRENTAVNRGAPHTAPNKSQPNGSGAANEAAAAAAAATTTTTLPAAIAAAELPADVIIGAELAARTGLNRVGDEGWILTGRKREGQSGHEPRVQRVRIAGTFRSGLYDYDASWIYVPLAVLAAGDSAAAAAISIEVADIYQTGRVAQRVRRVAGDRWTIVDWREANRPLFAALELERRTVTLIISLIMLVAALSITTTLVLVVVERRTDIAILGAMGARARSIVAIFVIEGAVIGAAGAIAGAALGLAACLIGDRYELIRLPADVYSISAVPFHPTARDILLPALIAFVISLLATLYPARAAARVRPAEALRNE